MEKYQAELSEYYTEVATSNVLLEKVRSQLDLRVTLRMFLLTPWLDIQCGMARIILLLMTVPNLN